MDTKYTKDMTVGRATALLASLVAEVPQRLLKVDEAKSQEEPRGMTWSRRQLLGHLIDSASNNHQRFVRGQFQAQMSFPPYAQDDWIAVQGYAERPWVELVELWSAYNLHLLHVMRRVPAAAYGHGCVVSAGEGSTLAELMVDYVGHLSHHLEQILA